MPRYGKTRGVVSWARRGAAACALACAAIALGSAPAAAFRGHAFSFSFGKAGSGPGELDEPADVAVNDATGQVYVLDQGNSRIERFSATGVFETEWNGSETPAGRFKFDEEYEVFPYKRFQVAGIAVDNSCYFKDLAGGACTQADPSNDDVYVADEGDYVVDKFGPEGKYMNQLQQATGTKPFEFSNDENEKKKVHPTLDGVSVDSSGTVWAYYQEVFRGDVAAFSDSANRFIATSQLHSEKPPYPGFAVDSEDNLYTLKGEGESRRAITKQDGSGAVATEAFCSEAEPSGVTVDLASDEVFVDELTSVAACDSGGVLQEGFGEGHIAGGGGLAVRHEGRSESTVYVGDVAGDRVDVFSPEPPGAPLVQTGSTSVSEVTSDSARFQAEVNPHGAGTEYRFEYGRCVTLSTCPSSGYETSVPAPDGFVGSDFEIHGVSQNPEDLQAGESYHVRVVAHNAHGVVDGEEVQFSTQAVGVFELPDHRGWELVSPPDRHGALLEGISTRGLTQAAADGDAIAYEAYDPTESEPEGYDLLTQVLARRTPTGWSSQDIETPFAKTAAPNVEADDYRFFSTDLSLAAVQPFGVFDPLLSEEASEQTAFLRTDFLGGDVDDPCTSRCYSPFVTGCPSAGEACAKSVEEDADVPAGTTFAPGEEQCRVESQCGPKFLDATPDLSHAVLQSPAPLLTGAGEYGLYEWSAGGLIQLNLLPKGGGPAAGRSHEPALGYRSTNARGAVSTDGARVVWSENIGAGHLYLSSTASGEARSVQLDAVQSGAGAGPPEPVFQLASSDGSRVFFTDTQRLTEDSGAAEKAPDLYECEISEVDGEPACELSDLTPAREGHSADVQKAVLGASEDGSYLYLVATGVLAENEGAAEERAKAGSDNLYLLHREGTQWNTAFIARLSEEDAPDWASKPASVGTEQDISLQDLTARVSPDGRFLAFMSDRALSGQDDLDARSGRPDEQVYEYDAEEPISRTNPACVSCQPTGARPLGVEYQHISGISARASLVGSGGVWALTTWLAANVPGWTPYGEQSEALYQSRYLSDEGRLFFNSYDALVPQDVNGTWDVYEYEPPGVGTCSVSSSTYSERSGGCVDLISSGTSNQESAFVDASESGEDVFFLSSAHLAGENVEAGLSLYDAHECTPSSPCPSPEPQTLPPCTTEASCKAPPSPQPEVFGAPTSALFSGLGDLSPAVPAPTPSNPAKTTTKDTPKCKPGFTRKQGKCVRAKKAPKAKRSSMRRRRR